MKTLKNLKKGDKVVVLSTARKVSMDEIKFAITIFESWGLVVELAENLFEEDNQFAGTVSQRTQDLQSMIDRRDIKAIFFARGGYGTVQIIDNLNFSKLSQFPKWLVGYSDVTVIHSHLNKQELITLHATMPINFVSNKKTALDSLYNVLFNNKNKIQFKSHYLNKLGTVNGKIVGGNLSIIYSLIGSKSELDTQNKILFLEDIDEYLYHIDRMMINLDRNNILSNIKALIVGSMTNMNDNEVPFGKSANEIIHSYASKYDFPICFNFPSGHIDDNRTIVFGVDSCLNIDERGVSLHQFIK